MAQAAPGRPPVLIPHDDHFVQRPGAPPAGGPLRDDVPRRTTRSRITSLRGWRPAPWLLVLLACLAVAAAAYIDYSRHGLTLDYLDGRTKLSMARRMWDNLDPGFGQIGGIWLPLPTLLMALTAWFNPAYYSGFAGSLWSMLAFAGTGAFLFLLGRRMAGHWAGGIAAALLLVANPAAIYFATTPMAESLLICGMTAVVYLLDRVEERPRDQQRLAQLGVAALLLSLTRYEGWFMLATACGFLAVIWWRRGMKSVEMQARMIAFLMIAGLGVAFWLIWETLIFHNPLYFSGSKFSAHAIDVVASGIDYNVHNLGGSLTTYWQALAANAPVWMIVLAAAGVVLYVAREGHNWREARIAPLALLAVPLCFLVIMFSGQGAIDMRGAPYYNVRYGTISVPLVAAFAAYAMVTAVPWRRLKPAAAGAALLVALSAMPAVAMHKTAVLQDRAVASSTLHPALYAYLREHYDGGRLMLEAFRNVNSDVTFSSHIAQKRFITEGNPEIFNAAVYEPERFARWVYASREKNDRVAEAISVNPNFLDFYDIVYAGDDADLYRLKPQYDQLLATDGNLRATAREVLQHLAPARKAALQQ